MVRVFCAIFPLQDTKDCKFFPWGRGEALATPTHNFGDPLTPESPLSQMTNLQCHLVGVGDEDRWTDAFIPF